MKLSGMRLFWPQKGIRHFCTIVYGTFKNWSDGLRAVFSYSKKHKVGVLSSSNETAVSIIQLVFSGTGSRTCERERIRFANTKKAFTISKVNRWTSLLCLFWHEVPSANRLLSLMAGCLMLSWASLATHRIGKAYDSLPQSFDRSIDRLASRSAENHKIYPCHFTF